MLIPFKQLDPIQFKGIGTIYLNPDFIMILSRATDKMTRISMSGSGEDIYVEGNVIDVFISIEGRTKT